MALRDCPNDVSLSLLQSEATRVTQNTHTRARLKRRFGLQLRLLRWIVRTQASRNPASRMTRSQCLLLPEFSSVPDYIPGGRDWQAHVSGQSGLVHKYARTTADSETCRGAVAGASIGRPRKLKLHRSQQKQKQKQKQQQRTWHALFCYSACNNPPPPIAGCTAALDSKSKQLAVACVA